MMEQELILIGVFLVAVIVWLSFVRLMDDPQDTN